MIEIIILFGSDLVRDFNNSTDPEFTTTYDGEGSIMVKKFASEAEKAAYLEGIEDAYGWGDYCVAPYWREDIYDFTLRILVRFYSECTVDRYGQVPKFNMLPSLFGDRIEEVKASEFLEFSTYGSTVGNYEAFTVKNKDLIFHCNEALKNNPNYKWAMTC